MTKNMAVGLGILCSTVFGVASTALASLVVPGGLLILSLFIILPAVMGIINAFFWRKHELSRGETIGYGFLNFLFAVIAVAFFMGEGYICVLVVSPLMLLFLMLGILLGRRIFERDDRTLNLSVAAVLAGLVTVNVLTASPSGQVVTDRVVIQASPEEVWEHVVSFEPVLKEPEYWLFRIGLPSPVQSVSEGDFVGANRQCIFTDGIVFEEKITELEPGRKLTFDIVKQPQHPEIMGHLELLRGQFILEDNGDGTTTLIGHSWYDLKIKPSVYFDWWTRSILSNVHIRVMDHIKELSERESAA